MIKTRVEALSTSAELLVSGAGASAGDPITVIVGAASADDVFLGGSDVSAANGYPLGDGQLTLVLGPGDSLYAIAGSGTPTVNVMTFRA